MAKLFADNKIVLSSYLLPYGEFKLFSDLKALTPNEKMKEMIIKKAEEYLDKPIEPVYASTFREFTLTGVRANYENKMFGRRTMAFYLAVAEWLEDKGRFTDKLIDVIWAIMEESTWINSASYPNISPYGAKSPIPAVFGPDRLHGIDLFSPSCGATLALIYHLLKDKLDAVAPVICEKLVYSVKERIIKPYLHCTFWWMGEGKTRVNNWGPWISSNILFITAILEEDSYKRAAIVNRVANTLDVFTNDYHEDGGCDEGPSYWGAAGASLFDCLEILEDMTGGKLNLYGHPLVKAIGEYIYKVNISGKYFVNFADCHSQITHDDFLLRRFGEKVGSKSLYGFGQQMALYFTPGLGFSHPYRTFKRLFAPEVVGEIMPAPRRNWLAGLKVMTARSTDKWDKGAFFAMKGGTNGESHNHNDVGSFVFYYDGKPVLIDAGVGKYTKTTFGPNRYTLWFMRSEYHNLPAFDGIGQLPGAKYASKDECYDEESCSLSMELKNAYDPRAGVVSLVRSARLDGAKLTVTDSFELDTEREVDVHLLTHVKPEILSEGKLLLAEGRTLTFDTALTPEIEEYVSEGLDTVAAWGTPVLYRIHLKARASSGSFTMTVE